MLMFHRCFQANGFRPHFELLEMIGAVEFEAGNEASLSFWKFGIQRIQCINGMEFQWNSNGDGMGWLGWNDVFDMILGPGNSGGRPSRLLPDWSWSSFEPSADQLWFKPWDDNWNTHIMITCSCWSWFAQKPFADSKLENLRKKLASVICCDHCLHVLHVCFCSRSCFPFAAWLHSVAGTLTGIDLLPWRFWNAAGSHHSSWRRTATKMLRDKCPSAFKCAFMAVWRGKADGFMFHFHVFSPRIFTPDL